MSNIRKLHVNCPMHTFGVCVWARQKARAILYMWGLFLNTSLDSISSLRMN